MVLSPAFFQRDTLTVARELVGKELWRDTPEGRCGGVIVETEAYGGRRDPAAHSYKGRTDRVAVLFGEKGHAYIYQIYGMYMCLNLACGPQDEPECVLIRALEPMEGLPQMAQRRGRKEPRELCSGPGKLCRALALTREQNGLCVTRADSGLFVSDAPSLPTDASRRVNIDYAGEAAAWPWRFTARGSAFLSRRPDRR